MSNYRTYIIAKHAPTDELDALNHLGGRIYSKTVSLVRKTHRKKGLWLSQVDAKKYLKFKEYPCHAHSVQAIIDDYYGALKSYFSRVKKDPTSKPPYRTRKFHTFTWRASGISCNGTQLKLSRGRGREPIILDLARPFQNKVPTEVSMVFNRDSRCYEFHATYAVGTLKGNPKPNKTVAVDMGEIHPIVCFDGNSVAIYNGRLHRAITQYREKFLAQINRMLSRCKRGSHRYKQLKRTKRRVLYKLANQIRDYRHKITSRFVSACRVKRVQTIAIGALTHIRQSINYSKKSNQKLHQWPFAQITNMIEYKAENVGIKTDTVDEAYTSQTCPRCGHRHKSSNRNYHCKQCDFSYHRDGVGAINLWRKYQEWLLAPVVGPLASPVGVRFHWHLCRLDSWSPTRGLISKKPVMSR